MMVRLFSALFVLALLITTLDGCVSYAPVLAPPAKPLLHGQGEILGGYSAQLVEDEYVTDGLHAGVRYGFSDRVSLGGVLWTTDEIVWNGFSPDGMAAEAIVRLGDTSAAAQFGALARYNWLFEGNSLVGTGAAAGAVAWFPDFWSFRSYAAVLAGYGWSTPEARPGVDQMFVLQEHVGASYELPWGFQLRGEVAMLQQRVRDNGAWKPGWTWALLPAGTLTWTFTTF